MGHIVLLGDSIFDNARYVPDRPAVVEQVRQSLPRGWSATLLAKDGAIAEDVAIQLGNLPPDATHLVVSAGGNDVLGESAILNEAACTVGEALGTLAEARSRFEHTYSAMLEALREYATPTVVCTVYDTIPGFGAAERAALACFNELILREAVSFGLPVIDLRLLFDRPGDYSHVSPIEPSTVGGAKIARVIGEVVTKHDFGCRQSVVYF